MDWNSTWAFKHSTPAIYNRQSKFSLPYALYPSALILFFLACSSSTFLLGRNIREPVSGTSTLQSDSVPVCWHGPALEWGGQLLTGRAGERDGIQGEVVGEKHMRISGEGCRRCSVGFLCTFELRFSSNFYFWFKGKENPEVMITLSGPALVPASITVLDNHDTSEEISLLVHYQSWDAGNFTTYIDADCGGGGDQPVSRRLATLPIEISTIPPSPFPPPTPCTQGQFGRWVSIENKTSYENAALPFSVPSIELNHSLTPRGIHDLNFGKWEFRPYECLGSLQDMKLFGGTLLDKGVREVSIIGDSHLRAFMCSIEYMAGDSRHNEVYQYHGGNREWKFKDESRNATLSIHYLELYGIFGLDARCDRPEKSYTETKWQSTSDIVIIDAGAWTYKWCRDPRKAFAKHLPQFLESVKANHKDTAQIFLRSTPPFPTRSIPCLHHRAGHRRNVDLKLANDWMKSVAQAYDIRFIDLWPVEAPRYDDTCWKREKGKIEKDHHYTCMDDSNLIYGVVGEAATRCLAHVIVHSEYRF